MDDMSPQQQQQQENLSRGQHENKRRMKSQSYRRQSAPSLVITKALTRSKTLSRESFLVPVGVETCPLVQSLLKTSHRSFLLHGHAQLKTGMQTQDRHLFMFNDILVIAKAKTATHFKQKAQVLVCEMWTANCMEEVCEGSTSPERSFVLGWPTCNCAAMFSSAELKEQWLSLIKSRIKEEKEKEVSKTIPLRVYGKGINAFAVTKTLPVSNWDSTNEVIRLALQQFSIIGKVKDYQLWVVSKRDNAPYPLIGHEFPFSIQMSHVRQMLIQVGSGESAAPPTDRQRALHLEHGSKMCQFILKPRPLETALQQMTADFPQKTFRRRRSLITWAFWRGSYTQLHQLSPSSAAPGCLFNQPLSAVCVEEALPKPVVDMLTFLYHEGSWTRGIFRRPAGARAVRELRDSLDAGGFQLPLTRDHVFVIAGVFKDFLRSIPGSLLSSELYEDWVEVLEEEEEEEERLQDIQRLIARLPKENAVLLRHLLAVLYAIQSYAHENQMTSFNLSVCIAPSMLWPPGAPCSSEVEGEATKKVCHLVRFMIEHSPQVLGHEPAALFGGPPKRDNLPESESESWMYPMTDSSYDSLENELDNSSGGSPGSCRRRRLRSKALQGSLDSILTFSDCEQDRDLHPLGRPRAHTPDADLGRGGEDEVPTDGPSAADTWSLDGHHRERRRSEPALAYVSRLTCASQSTDGLTGEDEDDDGDLNLNRKISTQARRGGSSSRTTLLRSAALETSSSSFASTSPAPTHSSLDSLDSLCNDHSLSGGGPQGSTKNRWSSETFSPSKEPINLGAVKCHRSLHPNSWLKKDRRLSLNQAERAEEETVGCGDKSTGLCKRVAGKVNVGRETPINLSVKCRSRAGKVAEAHVTEHPGKEEGPPSVSHHCSPIGQTLHSSSERRAALPLFYKPSGPSLSLFKRQKWVCSNRLHLRRGSEPESRVMDQVTGLSRARLPSDPGLKVSEVDSDEAAASRYCVSPHASQVVRDYFSTHRDSHPDSSQQVALALLEKDRQWAKRCSDPAAETDLDQLLFAEESYV
ncbi:rho GTPase-activating protein 20-like isoform 2-T2 [Synchiropus picturatus]